MNRILYIVSLGVLLIVALTSCGKMDPVEARAKSPEYVLCKEDNAELTLSNLDAYAGDLTLLSELYKVDDAETVKRVASMTLNLKNLAKEKFGQEYTAKEVMAAMVKAFPDNAPKGELQYAETGGMVLTLIGEGYSLDSAAAGVKGVVGSLYKLSEGN